MTQCVKADTGQQANMTDDHFLVMIATRGYILESECVRCINILESVVEMMLIDRITELERGIQ